MTRRIFALALALVACNDDRPGDDDVGESTSESSGVSESDDSSNSTDADGSETSGDSTDSTDSDSTDESETDATDSTETGDPSCEDDSYVGLALAEDDWGLGDLCDEIWVCADEAQAAEIEATLPGATCDVRQDCPVSHCTISWQTIVDEAVFAAVCDALMLPGIDAAYCIVYGP